MCQTDPGDSISSLLHSSLKHDPNSAMSSNNNKKPRKLKQKSLLSWVWPQDNKTNIEDEKLEKSCAAELPERSFECGQDYAAVESIETVGSQLPLLGDRRNQPRNCLNDPF